MGNQLLVIEPAADCTAARLGDWLVEAGLELGVCRPHAGDPVPETTAGYDGLLVMGGGMGAGDDAEHPWLADVRAVLRAAVAAETPTLGVCLGAQLLAAATGGRVAALPDGPELGAHLVAKRAAASTDPLFGPVPITPDVLQWHFDAIVELPPGAVHLFSAPASAPDGENQAFRLGRLAWGVQFHIETTPAIVREWARVDAPRLPEYDLDAILAGAVAIHDDLAETWAPFAATFAAIVQDPASVRAARGVAVSTAEPITDPAAIRAALAAEMNAARGGPAPLPMPGVAPPAER